MHTEAIPTSNGTRVPRILLAEDDLEMRRLLKWSLDHAGFAVVECPDGDTLLRKLGAPAPAPLPYDLVITDERMPGLTGTQAIRQGLLAGANWPPVILITAFPDPELRERALWLGAKAVLAKPFDVDSLLALVDRILPEQTLLRRARPIAAPALPFPLEITSRHGELAPPLRDFIAEAAARFAPHAEQIREIAVVVDEARPAERYRRRFLVSLRVRTNAGAIAVKLDSAQSEAPGNPYLTLRQAFATAWQQYQRSQERRLSGRLPAGIARGA